MKNLDKAMSEVAYAYDNVEFYHTLYENKGGRHEEVSAHADFIKLPYTFKVNYRKNFPKKTLAEGYTPAHPMITNSRSSGSTGERLITLEIGMYLLDRATTCAKINTSILEAFTKPARKIARYAAPNCSDVECANPNSRIEDRLLSDKTLVLPVYHDLMTTPATMLCRTIDEIEEYAPDLFYVDPTHFSFLLRSYKKQGKVPPLIPVMSAYTGATRCSKRQIAEYYPMDSYYGELLSSTEFGWVAMECTHGSLHVNDDSFFFEYIPNDIKSPIGTQFKELCITSIDQGASPHIRYRTGDIVTVKDTPCTCGSDRKVIVMEGKVSHFVIKDDQPAISPQEIDCFIGAPIWLDVYQLEQKSETDFDLKLIVNENYTENSESYFLDKLSEALATEIRVNICLVEYISSERSGKFQFVRGLHSNV